MRGRKAYRLLRFVLLILRLNWRERRYLLQVATHRRRVWFYVPIRSEVRIIS